MSDATQTGNAPVKLSPVEKIKAASEYLRGQIADELLDQEDGFGKDSIQLLKHHGTYQQDDRDLRNQLREQGLKGKALSMMVRTRIPGGRLTAEQFLAEMDLGDQLGNGTMRLTTRQAIQHHGIPKGSLRDLIRAELAALQATLMLRVAGPVRRAPRPLPTHTAGRALQAPAPPTRDLAGRKHGAPQPPPAPGRARRAQATPTQQTAGPRPGRAAWPVLSHVGDVGPRAAGFSSWGSYQFNLLRIVVIGGQHKQ